MIFHAHLMDAATGEVVIYVDKWDHGWTDEETRSNAVFQWEENNNSCDCNRLPYFCQAKGLEDPGETTCGFPLILCKLMEGETVLFSDWVEDTSERERYVKMVMAERERHK